MEIQVLRILKPDGHLLWTMKASQEDKSTEFGLFEQNLQVHGWKVSLHRILNDAKPDLENKPLQGLVKTGKCEIVKQERSKQKLIISLV